MPLPRGRKSLPTMFSRTEDFPDDCEPTTTYKSVSKSPSTAVDEAAELEGCSGAYDLR